MDCAMWASDTRVHGLITIRTVTGKKPFDDHWRRFIGDLRLVFFGLCAYCERGTKGVVDHFMPKSKFPDLVYIWSNWLFVCNDCNGTKGSRWPVLGYIDPCAEAIQKRPERYFDWDLETGHILVKRTLGTSDRQKARTMLKDLALNDGHHLTARLGWIEIASVFAEFWMTNASSELRARIVEFASRNRECSSIVRAVFVARGIPLDISGLE